ncbi:hypothetical protein JCM14076_29710 [Methylosoma difficile]
MIERNQLLIDRFTDWPSFHDAEVLKLTFERGNHLEIIETDAWSKRIPESLTASFYVFDWRYGAESPPYRETIVTIRFESFGRFGLDGFNYQNPIIGLGITKEYSENLKKELFAVDWGRTALPHEVSFTCERIVIESVEPITWPNPLAKWSAPN